MNQEQKRLPNRQEIESMLAFIPKFNADDFQPIVGWDGSYPKYHPVMYELQEEINKPCWIGDSSTFGERSKEQLKTGDLNHLVDFFSRYRRAEQMFLGGQGHATIEGYVMTVLLRLQELLSGSVEVAETSSEGDIDYLDIPAFLRRQAD